MADRATVGPRRMVRMDPMTAGDEKRSPCADTVTLFQRGDFTLASGEKSTWKIECDALTPADWDALAVMLVERLPSPFCGVYGVPRGGIPLMKALVPHQRVGAANSLVVDDVWTTGGSMRRFIQDRGISPTGLLRAVVFARNPVPADVTALFVMPHFDGYPATEFRGNIDLPSTPEDWQ